MILERDSYILRNHSHGRVTYDTVERMCNLSANIAVQCPQSFNDDGRPIHSHRLLMELQRAWSEMPFAISELKNPQNWNIGALLKEEKRRGEMVPALREPKIAIDVEVTKPGNLSVRWYRKDDDIREDAFERRDFERPPNELLFIRGFRDAFYDVNHKDDPWRANFASAVLDTCIGAVEETIHFAGKNFQVERNWMVRLRYENGKVTSFEETNYQTREARRLAPLLKEKQEFEAEVGMSCERIVGLNAAYGSLGASPMRTAAILRDHFSLNPELSQKFSVVLKNADRLIRAVASKPDQVVLTEEQTKFSPINPIRERSSMTQMLNTRIASTANHREASVATKTVPIYPKRIHPASEEELAALGVATVQELVDKVNGYLLKAGDFPISAGDFPTNRRLFDRLVARHDRLGLGEVPQNLKL